MRIEHGHGGIVAEPGERRGDKGAAFGAEITPVILVLIFARQAIRQARAVNRAGNINLSGAAAKAGRGSGEGTAEGLLRAFGDDVNQAARIENAVERRGRAFQHLYALGCGIKAARQHGAQAVGHDRAVAVRAKSAAHEGILRTAQGVGLHHVADVIERFIQRGGMLILKHFIADGIDHLRDVQHRHVG